MGKSISSGLIKAVTENREEILRLVAEKPDWDYACGRFDDFYNHMLGKNKSAWSDEIINTLNETYFAQRDKDKGMSNITLRTVNGMPEKLKNDTRIIFLQIAEVCCIFNASHKVNFEAGELPYGFDKIKMIPSKIKGSFTFEKAMPSLYKKTSLTFDYWVPKILEWTTEIRDKNLKEWKNESILQHESCTDFMRICMLFLSDNKNNPPIAKTEDRMSLLTLLNEEFCWIKKSSKREDIVGNSAKLKEGLSQVNIQTGIEIPLESWNRILYSPFLKPLIK
jgi:hypothetical protein